MISLRNIYVSATSGIVLKNISIDIEPKECVAIVGSSGSRKSLLLSIIFGETKPDKGSILVDKLPLEKLSPKLLQIYRQSLGILLQKDQLLPNRSIASNVALPLEIRKIGSREMSERTVRILKSVKLEEKIVMPPAALNHNERRLVALAQAIIAKPQILVLDEPFGDMEQKYARIMLRILKNEQRRGATIIIATNNPKSVHELDPRIIRIEKGRLISNKNNKQSVTSSKISITPKTL